MIALRKAFRSLHMSASAIAHKFTIVPKKLNISLFQKTTMVQVNPSYSLLKTFRAISRIFESPNSNDETINI